MGECGCAETNPDFLLPHKTPLSMTLGVQVYRSCRDCQTPFAIDIYRFDKEFSETFFNDVPVLEIKRYGPETVNGVGTWVLLDPADLPTLATEHFGDVSIEELDADDWRFLLQTAISQARNG